MITKLRLITSDGEEEIIEDFFNLSVGKNEIAGIGYTQQEAGMCKLSIYNSTIANSVLLTEIINNPLSNVYTNLEYIYIQGSIQDYTYHNTLINKTRFILTDNNNNVEFSGWLYVSNNNISELSSLDGYQFTLIDSIGAVAISSNFEKTINGISTIEGGTAPLVRIETLAMLEYLNAMVTQNFPLSIILPTNLETGYSLDLKIGLTTENFPSEINLLWNFEDLRTIFYKTDNYNGRSYNCYGARTFMMNALFDDNGNSTILYGIEFLYLSGDTNYQGKLCLFQTGNIVEGITFENKTNWNYSFIPEESNTEGVEFSYYLPYLGDENEVSESFEIRQKVDYQIFSSENLVTTYDFGLYNVELLIENVQFSNGLLINFLGIGILNANINNNGFYLFEKDISFNGLVSVDTFDIDATEKHNYKDLFTECLEAQNLALKLTYGMTQDTIELIAKPNLLDVPTVQILNAYNIKKSVNIINVSDVTFTIEKFNLLSEPIKNYYKSIQSNFPAQYEFEIINDNIDFELGDTKTLNGKQVWILGIANKIKHDNYFKIVTAIGEW